MEGTVTAPGIWGCVNWGGGAFLPDRDLLVIKTSEIPTLAKLMKVHADGVHSDYRHAGETELTFAGGIPISNPPYGRLLAINLRSRSIEWQFNFGDWWIVRDHPRLRDLPASTHVGVPGAPGPIATRSGLVFVGGGDKALWAIDARTGRELWRYKTDAPTTATPMTYRTSLGKQFVVIAVGSDNKTKLLAFSR